MKKTRSRRYIINRILMYTGAVILALWTLAPIYLHTEGSPPA